MSRFMRLAVALAVGTAMGSAAFATEGSAANPASDQSQNPGAAQRDFTKLSTQGRTALLDVHLARIAIFNGDPADARREIAAAQTAIGKAQNDDTAFIKAEADMRAPSGTQNGVETAAYNGSSGTASAAGASTTQVKWLPIDGSMSLGEDYTATSKAAGVQRANAEVQNGNAKGAIQALKLAQVNEQFVVELLPLDRTMNGIDQAAQLIDQHRYYQANDVLMSVENGVRYDTEDLTGIPQRVASK